MSRIYYRGGMSPFETFSPGYILTHNVIGTNVGNFLYLNGVLRSLMIDDNTVIQANYYNTIIINLNMLMKTSIVLSFHWLMRSERIL